MKIKELKQVGDWISKRDAMQFLNYKTTQMNQFLKDYASSLRIARIGQRVLISLSRMIQILELNECKND